MIGGLKECGNFAGEKKGTLKLVIHFLYSIPYYSIVYLSFSILFIYINIYPRTFHNTLCSNTYFFSFLPRIVKR